MTTGTLEPDLVRLYAPGAKQAVVIDVPEMRFLMVDGQGDPNTAVVYRQSLEALYSVSYTLKFALKKTDAALDFRVRPLEGLWWSDDHPDFLYGRRERWWWTMMIAQPPQVTPEAVAAAMQEAGRKKPLAALAKMRCETFAEGLCAQILHIGPYSAEGPTIERLHAFIHDQGYVLRGKHHEIYQGDPRRAAPEKLKTVIRQPLMPR